MLVALTLWLSFQSYDDVLRSGVQAFEERRFEEAESLFRSALELEPGEAAPRLLLGQVLIDTDRPRVALEVLSALGSDEPAVRCMRGRALLDLGDARGALQELEAVAVEQLADPSCRESLGLARIQVGDADGALAALSPLVEGSPVAERSPALNTTYGMALALAGRHEEAVEALRAALEAEPRRSLALFYLGRSLQLLDRTEEAAEVYARGTDFRPPENIRFVLGLARAHITLGRLDEARRELDVLVSRHPRVGRAWLLRGIVAFEERDYERSAQDARRAIELGYTLAEADLRLGMALGMLGRYDEAIEALHAASAKEPELAVASYYEGLFLFRKGEALSEADDQLNPFGLRALRLLERSEELLPNPHTSLAMAEAYLRLGQHLRAVEAASRAAVEPELAPRAHHLRALAHHEMLEYEPAEEAYEEAFAAGADSAEIHHDLGNLLSVMGRWEEARVALERSLERDPSAPRTHLELGIALHYIGRGSEALKELELATSLMPESSEAWYQKGLVESEAGDTDGSVSSWRKALELAPGDSRLLYRLAAELLKLGRMEERAALLAEFQTRQRDGEAREQREERLDNVLRAALKAVDDGDEAGAASLLHDARSVAPDDPRPYIYLADFLASNARRAEAVGVLEEGLERLPNNLALREMRRSLENDRDRDRDR